jgi:hypothetical protein
VSSHRFGPLPGDHSRVTDSAEPGGSLAQFCRWLAAALGIQSGALQGVAVYLRPAEAGHCDDFPGVVDCPGLTLLYTGLVPFEDLSFWRLPSPGTRLTERAVTL